MATKAQVRGLGEFAILEFTLEHPDDHVVELHHQGEFIALFSQTGATKESIQAECTVHLVEKHAGTATYSRRNMKITNKF